MKSSSNGVELENIKEGVCFLTRVFISVTLLTENSILLYFNIVVLFFFSHSFFHLRHDLLVSLSK